MSALLSYWEHVTDAPDASFHAEAHGRDRSGLLTYVPQRPPGEYSRPPMVEHAFCLMVSGSGPAMSDLGFGRYEGPIGPGAMLLAPAEGPIHTALTFTSRVLVVIPPPDALSRAQDALGLRLDIERLSLRLTQDTLAAELLKALHRENAAGAGELFVDYAVGTLVAALAGGSGATSDVLPPAARGLAPWQARRAVAFLTDRLEEEVSLADVANTVGLSPYHFARAFKATTGEPPHRFRMALRVERAKEMLAGTGESVTAIAHACGFASSQHMATVFRRLLGTTPSAYRRVGRS